MTRKFYLLLFFIPFSGLFQARAQQSGNCTAQFSYLYSGDLLYFRAVDSTKGTKQRWYFGDSTKTGLGNNVAPTHTYAGPGTYTVSLVVSNTTTGCYDSASQVITIVPPPPPPQCSISFNYSHDSTAKNKPYFFYASTFLGGATQDTVTWMVNGTRVGTGDTLKRVLAAGQYAICASLSTSTGCQSQSCQNITVTDSSTTTPPPVVTPPDTAITIPPDSTVKLPADTTHRDTTINRTTDTLGSFLSSYPNPVSGQVHMDLKMDKAEMINIRIYNSMGTQVQAIAIAGIQGTNQLSLNVSNLQSGVYYIQIQHGSEVKRSRIQKL
jgi:PKD repeat protein